MQTEDRSACTAELSNKLEEADLAVAAKTQSHVLSNVELAYK